MHGNTVRTVGGRMMKCLYRNELYVSTKNHINWIKLISRDKIYYGEFPNECIETYEYDQLDSLDNISFHKKSLFNRKEYKQYDDWWSYIILDIYPDDALLFKTTYIKIENVSFEDLSKYMNVHDFIEYLKDNGLNICPVKL